MALACSCAASSAHEVCGGLYVKIAQQLALVRALIEGSRHGLSWASPRGAATSSGSAYLIGQSPWNKSFS